MLRVSTYILLLVMIVNHNPALQLLKLPKLFEHYNEHSKLIPGLSFADFLSMHYWGTDANDKDNDKDRQLPFKGKIATGIHHDAVVTFSQTDLSVPIEFRSIVYNASYEEAFTARYFASLFRPPQAV